MSGRLRTKTLTQAAVGHLVKKNYSCAIEVGILPWGRRRCDLIACNLKRNIIIVEVKQSWADFKNDSKYSVYLDYCNQFYFCLPFDIYTKYKEQITTSLDKRIGIMVLGYEEHFGITGHIKVVRPAKVYDIPHENKRDIITRLAWRGGLSKRNTRRTRLYLEKIT